MFIFYTESLSRSFRFPLNSFSRSHRFPSFQARRLCLYEPVSFIIIFSYCLFKKAMIIFAL